MPRKTKPEPAPKHQCNGTWPDPEDPRREVRCQELVSARRPSETGAHFCSSPRCQTSKQRFYRQRAARLAKLREQAVDPSAEMSIRQELAEGYLEFLRKLVSGSREDCAHCGHRNVIVGYAHRRAVGGGPCVELGKGGPELPIGWADIVYPERAPERRP